MAELFFPLPKIADWIRDAKDLFNKLGTQDHYFMGPIPFVTSFVATWSWAGGWVASISLMKQQFVITQFYRRQKKTWQILKRPTFNYVFVKI